MKFDAIEMMHSLSNRCFSDLEAVAASEGVHVCDKYSKVELICAIIANRAAALRCVGDCPIDDKRDKYRIITDDNECYYVELTPAQLRFVEWAIDNGVNLYEAECEEMNDIKWETP